MIAQNQGNANYQIVSDTLSTDDVLTILAKLLDTDNVQIIAQKDDGSQLNANQVKKATFEANCAPFIGLKNVNVIVQRQVQL